MRFLVIKVAVFCLVLTGTGGGALADTPRTITVTGAGVVTAVPDMAVITIGVESRAREAADAMAETSAKMATLFDLADAADIDRRDLQTSRLSLHANYDHSNSAGPSITGYVAGNTVQIRLRDIDQAGAVLDTLLRGGANVLQGITFDLQDRTQLLREARMLAVQDALDKARLYASAAGGEAGAVLRIDENMHQAAPAPMMRMAVMSAPMPVAAGELEISASVTLVIALE